jgi:hypothetical protein
LVAGGSATLRNNTVVSNTAGGGLDGSGGGICASGGMVTMSRNTVQSITADDVGGGLYVTGSGTILNLRLTPVIARVSFRCLGL